MSIPISNNRISTEHLPGFSATTEPPKKPLRILILEDVVTDAALVERELRKAQISFESRCVESRKDFLEALEEFHPDIILSDYSMPQFTALEALNELNDSPAQIPFILVTGSQSEEV